MQTVILPGYSQKNKQWVDDVSKKLKLDGIVRPIVWDHWVDDSQKFSAKEKATLIARHARGETLNIIAKSIGTLVFAYIIEQIPSQINKVVICGIPLKDFSEEEKLTVKKALLSLPKDKIIFIQNDQDPHASYNEVRDFLGNNANLISKEANNHNYPYFEDFNKFLLG